MNTSTQPKMRAGFTMIELIFVIVIIGILAAVAIPRLAATRDDAKIATALSEAGMILREVTTYYTANGEFSSTASDMSNVADFNNTLGSTFTDNNSTVVMTYFTPSNNGQVDEPCISYTFSNASGTVTVAEATGTHTGNVCQGILSASTFTDKLATTHTVGGSNVRF